MIFWNVDYLPSVRTADSKRHAVKHKNKAILVTLKLQDKQKKIWKPISLLTSRYLVVFRLERCVLSKIPSSENLSFLFLCCLSLCFFLPSIKREDKKLRGCWHVCNSTSGNRGETALQYKPLCSTTYGQIWSN